MHGSCRPTLPCLPLPRASTQVALKRIPDVLNNAENAKRVLREVCILRRLSHPHIISLRDVFLKPSSTGEAWCGERWQPRRDVQPLGEAGGKPPSATPVFFW